MRNLLLLIGIIFWSFQTFSQNTCVEGDCNDGIGTMLIKYDDGTDCEYEGSFKYGKMNGQGIFKCDDFSEIGLFEHNSLIDGEYKSTGLFQKGTFVKRVLHGRACIETKSFENGSTIQSQGRFVNGSIFSGIIDQEDSEGRTEKCFYEDGELMNCTKNTENSYNPDDILGPEISVVEIIHVDNQTFVPISIKNVKMNILWDTGAFGLVFAKSDFQKLIEGGAQLYDLNLSIQTFGVLNIPSEAHYFILDGLRVGEMEINNVVCLYNPNFETSLLGLDFFNNFSDVHWEMKLGAISLYK